MDLAPAAPPPAARTVSWRRLSIAVAAFVLPWLYLGISCLVFAVFRDYPGNFVGAAVAFAGSVVVPPIVLRGTGARGRTRIVRTAVLVFVGVAQLVVIYWWVWCAGTFGTRQVRLDVPPGSWLSPLRTKWIVQTPGRPHSVTVSPDPSGGGTRTCLRFELRQGETYHDLLGETSYRAEADARDYPPMNAVRWYAFSVYFPGDFPREDNRLVLAQWHGTDKKYVGEVARMPTVAFRFRDGKFSITLQTSPRRILTNEDQAKRTTLYATRQFGLGRWHDFVMQAKWSCRDDGFINVWHDGGQVVAYRGPASYDDDWGPYFRFGLYRDDTPSTYVAYYADVRTGPTAGSIGFMPPPSTRP